MCHESPERVYVAHQLGRRRWQPCLHISLSCFAYFLLPLPWHAGMFLIKKHSWVFHSAFVFPPKKWLSFPSCFPLVPSLLTALPSTHTHTRYQTPPRKHTQRRFFSVCIPHNQSEGSAPLVYSHPEPPSLAQCCWESTSKHVHVAHTHSVCHLLTTKLMSCKKLHSSQKAQ